MDSSARGEATVVHGVELSARPLLTFALSLVLVASLALYLARAFGFGQYFPALEPFAMVSLVTAAAAIWGLVAHTRGRFLAARRPVTLRADRAGLTLTPVDDARAGTSKHLPRASVVDGYFMPNARAARRAGTLRLLGTMRRSRLEVEIADRDARDTLGALGLDAAAHRATFTLASPVLATLGRQVLAFCLVPLLTALPYGVVALLPLFALLAWPARLVVGSDGFLLTWLGTKQLVPMTDVVSVDADEQRGILLTTIHGKRLWHTGIRMKSTPPRQIEYRDAVLLRMREALTLARARLGAGRVAARVSRGGRPYPEWRAALVELRDGAGYRSPAIARDELWRLLEDPAARDDARAGAAFVLRAGSSEEELARLRDAAGATLAPRLRVALDAAVDGSDEAFDEALEADARLESQAGSRH